ncbi:DUF1223 domain-containing protein [Hymenobacter defluvii]|uniref:DUF1223 domain-containing protein n=1 Tax=Hymenobacter defluvii TaxID=2054411 RepID=A0ABS3TAG2_9BACT|nr:DUF1223 domain-containing protein [Hymenobacter defluvii]MBO3270651.1 DUF1223 domain-containing protein [Hymenobacter defluvii]
MKTVFLSLLSAGVLASVALPYASKLAPKTSAPTLPAAARVPVVVELFTSEGCSSCPAADATLRELAATQPVPGVEIVALGEHVDYWNRLGWKDAYSSAQFTERQRQYAARFGTGSYTPQAVVNGQTELVGSQRQKLTAAIAQAATAPRATIRLTRPNPTSIHVQVSSLPTGAKQSQVLLALTERGLSSQVGRGENAGRLLRHAPVVRALRTVGTVDGAGSFAATVPLQLAAQWQAAEVRAVVLVQETASRRIVGAASLAVDAGADVTP